MNGSWHRYRPGERWRRPAGRARLVIEVPGAVAVCFDAPVVELLEVRAEASTRRSGGSGRTCSTPDFDADEALRRLRDPVACRDVDRRGAARPARAGRDRQHLEERDAVDRTCLAVRHGRRPRRRDRSRGWSRPRAGSCSPVPAPRPASRGPDRRRSASGSRHVYGRTGRPCPRCRTPIASAQQGTDIPRTTYWCPTCQPTPVGTAPVADAQRSSQTMARWRVSSRSMCEHFIARSADAVPARRAVAVHREARAVTGSPGSAGARPGSMRAGGLRVYRDLRAFRDDPGARDGRRHRDDLVR